MNPRELMVRAVDPVIAVVEGVKPDQLGLPTPCSDYDVRGLINHFAGTTAWLESMGRRLPPDADDPFGANNDVTTGDWQTLLAARIRAVATAWDAPSAWEGSIEGVQMPATMIGEMALTGRPADPGMTEPAAGEVYSTDEVLADVEARRSRSA